MKQCSKCGLEKDTSEYYVRNKQTERLHAQCKTCYKEQRATSQNMHYAKYRASYQARAVKRRMLLRKEFRDGVLTYLATHPCVDCGELDIRVLEFDHIDVRTKSFSVSQAVRLGHRWPRVLKEIEKCRVLCSNCHKKRTATQFSWYKA